MTIVVYGAIIVYKVQCIIPSGMTIVVQGALRVVQCIISSGGAMNHP